MKKPRGKAAGVPDVVHCGHIGAFPIAFTVQSALGGWKADGETEARSSNPDPLSALDAWLPLKPIGMKRDIFDGMSLSQVLKVTHDISRKVVQKTE